MLMSHLVEGQCQLEFSSCSGVRALAGYIVHNYDMLAGGQTDKGIPSRTVFCQ